MLQQPNDWAGGDDLLLVHLLPEEVLELVDVDVGVGGEDDCRDILWQLVLNLLPILIGHEVGFRDRKDSLLVEKLRIVAAELVEQDFIGLEYVLRVGGYKE